MAKRIRIALIAAAMTLLLAMGAAVTSMSVHAEKNSDGTDNTAPNIVKNITVPQGVNFKAGDAVTFTFEKVANPIPTGGEAVTAPTATKEAPATITIKQSDLQGALDDARKDSATGEKRLTFNRTISDLDSCTDKVGEYTFKVKESVTGDSWTQKDDTVRYLHVYVSNENDTLTRTYSVTADNTIVAANEKTDLNFNNNYNGSAAKAEISKAVNNGQYVDKTQDYTFTVTFTKPSTADSLNLTTIAQNVKIYEGNTEKDNTAKVVEGKIQLTLKRDQRAEFTNLPAGTTMNVTEKTTGIGASYKSTDVKIGENTTKNTTTASTVLNEGNNTVAYTNNYQPTTITGVITQIAPFIAMVAIAGGAVALYLVSRRRRDA